MITRAQLAEVLDRRFLLACTAEEVERDLVHGDVGGEEALQVLLDAVREFLAFEPVESGGAAS